MPGYGSGPTPIVDAGEPQALWSHEVVPTTGGVESCSQAAMMRRSPNAPNCISIEVLFDADPGAFDIELQVADTDHPGCYVKKASLNTGLNATFVGRIEATNVVATFVRLKMAARANAVKVTARVS